jgi:hypothetical protein
MKFWLPPSLLSGDNILDFMGLGLRYWLAETYELFILFIICPREDI